MPGGDPCYKTTAEHVKLTRELDRGMPNSTQRDSPLDILIADDHEITLAGLKYLLDANPDYNVIGSVSNGLEVVPAVAKLKPDILLLDFAMPGKSGLAILQDLQLEKSATKVLFFSGQSSGIDYQRALKSGAHAIVGKNEPTSELLNALTAISDNGTYLSPSIRSSLATISEDTPGDEVSLTGREREILCLVALGKTNTEIGLELHISALTVKKHRQNFMRKLNVSSSVEAARKAQELGLAKLT